MFRLLTKGISRRFPIQQTSIIQTRRYCSNYRIKNLLKSIEYISNKNEKWGKIKINSGMFELAVLGFVICYILALYSLCIKDMDKRLEHFSKKTCEISAP